MNLELKRWNPFKFIRKTVGDPRSAPNDRSVESGNSDRTKVQERFGNLPNGSPFLSGDPVIALAELLREPFGFGEIDRWFGDFSSSRFRPPVDVVDDGDALRITAEFPGMDRNDLQVSVEGGMLVMSGEKTQDLRSEENGCYRLERSHGKFTRSVPLPEEVDPNRAEARFDKGVLSLRLPKIESSRSLSKKIEVK
ncbi:Hsp20/alpha crystallin family protein [Caballeronia sp. M23-90]